MGPHALYLVLLVAATAVVKGAGWLVEAASALAERYYLSESLAGLTAVALAASAPDAVLAVRASLAGEPGLAAGLAVGGCAANIGLVLGLGLLAFGLAPAGRPAARQAVAVAVTGLIAAYQVRDGSLSRPEGVCLLMVFCAAAGLCWRAWLAARWSPAGGCGRTPGGGRLTPGGGRGGRRTAPGNPAGRPVLPRLALGCLFLAIGSRYVVSAGGSLAAHLGLPPEVAGLTTVSAGTCVPEAAAALAAVARGWPEMALGCLAGAAVVNLSLVMGLSGVVRPFPVAAGTALLHLPLVILLALLLAVFGAVRRTLGRPEGAAFLAVYLAYLWLVLR